jgi:2'-5' RNA ligase
MRNGFFRILGFKISKGLMVEKVKQKQIRAFIAIELSQEFEEALAHLQARLKLGWESAVKWVEPKGVHLTLKFLGNIPEGMVPEVTEAIAAVARSVAPFHLELSQLGAFPNLGAPKVVWIGLGGDVESLLRLQRGIDRALVSLSFAAEARDFSPHLTLGRVRDRATLQQRRQLGLELSSLKAQEQLSLYVDKVSLMRSKLTAAGAIYSRLAAVQLALPTSPC